MRDEPESPLQSGLSHICARRFARGRRDLDAAVRLGGPEAPWAILEIVQSYLRQRRGVEIDGHLERLFDEPSALSEFARGCFFRRSGELSKARDALEAATRSPATRAAARVELAWLRYLDGQTAAATRLMSAALGEFRASGTPWGVSFALANRGALELSRFELRTALPLFDEAERLKLECGDRIGVGTVLHNRAMALQLLGSFRDALDSYYRARDIHHQLGDRHLEAHSWNNIGVAHVALGETRLAVTAYRRAIRIFTGSPHAFELAGALNGLADAYRSRPRLASRYARRAMDLASTGVVVGHVFGISLAILAENLTAMGRADEAHRELTSRPSELTSPDPRSLVMLERERARALLALGRVVEAEQAARAAVAVLDGQPRATRRGLLVESVEAQLLVGRCLAHRGEEREADRVLSAAIHRLDRLLAHQSSARTRIGLLDAYRFLHDARVEALVGRGRWTAAWRVSSRLKARELRRRLALPQRSSLDGGAADLLTEFERLSTSGIGPPDERRLRGLRERFSEVVERENVPTTALEERFIRGAIVDRMGDAATLVEYHVTSSSVFAFVLRRRGWQVVELGASSGLRTAISRILAPLRHAAASHGDVRAWLDAFDHDAARRLGAKLLDPILALSGTHERLVIVPDGPLLELPFELLRVPAAEGTEIEFASDARDMSYAESSLLAGAGEERVSRPQRVVAVGYSPPPDAAVWSSGERIRLGPLPLARREAAAVAALFTGGTCLVADEATASELERQSRDADVIHCATHAVSDLVVPALGGLILAGGDRRPELVTAARFAQWQLHRRRPLVTLSACSTGRGRVRGPEGMLGLGRVFLEAGAAAVVASRWPVDDRGAATLMAAFYRRLVAGDDRARALGRARRELRESSEHDHPFHWASFALVEHWSDQHTAMKLGLPSIGTS